MFLILNAGTNPATKTNFRVSKNQQGEPVKNQSTPVRFLASSRPLCDIELEPAWSRDLSDRPRLRDTIILFS